MTLVGSGTTLNRFGNMGGNAWTGTVIAPFAATFTGALLQYGTWQTQTQFNPRVRNLGFSGRVAANKANPSIVGVIGIYVVDVPDARFDRCYFEGLDSTGTGGGGVLIESSATGNLQAEGWRMSECYCDTSGYALAAIGKKSTDGAIIDLHTNACHWGLILGLSANDNVGGVMIQDCHLVGNIGTNPTGGTIGHAGTSGGSLPTSNTLLYGGPGPGGQQQIMLGGTNYLDTVASPTAWHAIINAQGFQAGGTGYWKAAGNQSSPAFIQFTASLDAVKGAECSVQGQRFDIAGNDSGITITGGTTTTPSITEQNATGGTFTFTINGTATAAIAWNASAAAIQTAINNALGAGTVTGATGGPLPTQVNLTFAVAPVTFTANVRNLVGGIVAMAQFLTQAGPPPSGTFKNNRVTNSGNVIESDTDTGVTVTAGNVTVTDASCLATDLNAWINNSHFAPGSYVTSVIAGVSFTVSQPPTGNINNGTLSGICPFQHFIDMNSAPFAPIVDANRAFQLALQET